MSTNFETLEQTLLTLPEPVLEEICTAFEVSDAIVFAKYLHTLEGLDDRTKGALLRAKVIQPPAAQPELLQQACERSMMVFWQRVGMEHQNV